MFYFVHQINYVLNNRGIFLTDIVYTDIAHLQIQFMMGIISLMALMILLLILNRLYSSCYACIDRMDSLTGTFTHRTFFFAVQPHPAGHQRRQGSPWLLSDG